MKDLSKSNIGEWVRYKPTGEIGRIKQFDNNKRIAWIVYKANNDWKRFENYTAASTKYDDLELLGMIEFSEFMAKRLREVS